MPKPLEIPFPDISITSQYFTADFDNDEPLSPAESIIVSKSVPKRISDFKTGRYCARQALSRFVNERPEILQGKAREPVWPTEIVGSISHSSKLAGAVVARQSDITAIGLDIETIGGVKPAMWYLLFHDSEQAFILNKQTDTALWATLFFSMKESFYKMQYPLTGLLLDFKDILISESDGNFYFSQVNFDHDLSGIAFNRIQAQWSSTYDQVITICFIQK
jgi:4'-phosphopantetheinyl transferase EntD